MTLQSMTGFARASASQGPVTWQWELRSVNGKTLDMRMRLASGFEALEAPARAAMASVFKRGNIQVSLQVAGLEAEQSIVINDQILEQVVARASALRKKLKGPALRADTLLAIRGIVELESQKADEAELAKRETLMLASLDEAIKSLARMRAEEGTRTRAVLRSLHDKISVLLLAAKNNPSRQPAAIRARLQEQVARILEQSTEFDQDRLHQEAVILATRADIQEEVDRLEGHLEAFSGLLDSKDAVGRKLDFLAQEFNREANTLCSKANDKSLTQIGLDLKVAIDQLREQVQNIE
jgi:uncharacterized protein (TIGR00255 family)